MSTLQPPNNALPQRRTTQKVNLRSDASAGSSIEAVLQPDALVWEQNRDGNWVEVWLHGWVSGEYLTPA